jgi:TetR/AcrR family transcriptional repressor of nem operon
VELVANTTNNQNTSQRILDIAERLVQTGGFNSFSYADIAAELGLTKASLHYHFPSKGNLGNKLIVRYEATLLAALSDIDLDTNDPIVKLRRYADLYATVLRNNRMCCCGVLSAEYSTLPRPMQEALRHYFDVNERWLVVVLGTGREAGKLTFEREPVEVAQLLVSSLEGANMIAYSYGDPKRFERTAELLLAGLAPKTESPPSRKSRPRRRVQGLPA